MKSKNTYDTAIDTLNHAVELIQFTNSHFPQYRTQTRPLYKTINQLIAVKKKHYGED